ncbi:CBS domain-containing protein [Neolewinella aurantiaca]|uniref:CBS domain-containing protein n=1 Tax=Neolewinella aurantiaca TaxID=2602767 RepID=A0A5C7FWB8_9BACT|nr:CBS domain-containing protein [Neolewinella aurantiaca]TXF89931.1 CBS domain-containing protein [Neolewinella aurantiaca]
MTAESLISDAIVPLNPADTGEEALGVMNEFYIRHLPVVEEGELKAVVSEDDILDADALQPVSSYRLPVQPPSVFPDDHLYDVMRILTEYKLTVVPVINREGTYIGMITNEDLLRIFGESSTFSSQGSIVVLEVLRQDYSLSEISRIVESEGAIILSSFVRSFEGSNRLEVTIKVNSQSIAATLATFERYNYVVQASYNEKQLSDSLRERFDSLMNYLEV